jgi:integrase
VYAGVDPVTGRTRYLTESTRDEKQTDVIMRRLLTEVDEQRNVRTTATLGAALDAWLRVHEVEQNTRKGYETHARLYIKPALGARAGLARCSHRCSVRQAGRPHAGRHRYPSL